jgi:hypothetical protein
MRYRHTVLHEKETIAADKTFTIDINTEDPISRIQLHARGTNSSDTPTAHPAKLITKIEVVDGSEVIVSLTGVQAQALAYYHTRRPVFNCLTYVDDNIVAPVFPLYFGRKLWDPELALDPKRYKNLQLKVSYDLNGGGSAPDAGQLEVVADVFDERKVSPIGLLVAKQHYAYTLTASGYETVQLPVDMPIRHLMISSLAAGYQPWQQYNEVKIDEDNDKHVILDQQTSDLLKYLAQELPPYVETLDGRSTTTAVAHYITPTYEVNAAFAGIGGYFSEITTTDQYGGRLLVDCNTASTSWQALVRGYCPHGAMGLDFGDPQDFEDWWDVRKLKSARCRIKAGSAGAGTIDLVTQQLKRY